MIRRLFRLALKFGLVAGVGAAVSKVLARRRSEPFAPASTAPWPPMATAPPSPDVEAEPMVEPEPMVETEPVIETVGAPTGGEAADPVVGAFAEPDDEGECPTSHPVKAKLASGVFHLPGMANYERTKADRCYADSDAAESDGLRQAKR